jgi:leucyl-tRNA---protein transferase
LRVPVRSFRPSHSQRRAWKRNAGEIEIRVTSPSITPEKIDLYAKFHAFGHQMKGWPREGHVGLELFMANPFRTEEWDYYIGERLIGVGYIDVLPEGLSAIYYYWDPDEVKRSLGTFNILKTIAAARERGMPHVYLCYFVDGCRSLQYKGRFRPNEILGPDGDWSASSWSGNMP